MKAWEPRQVQSRLAFSDEEEEDLLDFMYKYKTLRKTEIPLEVHGVWAGGACVCARASPGDLAGRPGSRLLGRPALPSARGWRLSLCPTHWAAPSGLPRGREDPGNSVFNWFMFLK